MCLCTFIDLLSFRQHASSILVSHNHSVYWEKTGQTDYNSQHVWFIALDEGSLILRVRLSACTLLVLFHGISSISDKIQLMFYNRYQRQTYIGH